MSALISSQILQLSSADGLWRAQINPVGSSLVSLWFGDVEIVTSPYGEPGFAAAGVVMAPWPNRLEDGLWSIGNREFTAPINDAEGHNANHGLVLGKTFEVVEQQTSRLELSTNLFDEAAYSFDVSLTVTFALENSGLEITISAANTGAESAPIAFGLHPYFVSEAGSQLQVNAKTWIQKDSRNLPTQAVSIEKSAMVKMGLNSVEEMYVDDCFTDLVAEEDFFVTRLTRPETGFTVELHQSTQLEFLMFYTLREESQQKRTLIAIEPQTAPANAFKNLDQVTLLSPGNSFAANCKINLRKNQ